MITWIPFAVFIGFLSLMGMFSFLDYRKKREITKKYFISFIIPCYNCSETIGDTIKGIFDSYEKGNFELFVINDNSTDDSLEKIKNLRKIYDFNIINNKENLGKASSINNTFEKTKGEIIFIVDADTIIAKIGVDDIIARFNYNEKVAAVSCPPSIKRNGFLPSMLAIEYNITNFIGFSHNIYSTIGLWGCCLAVKREVLNQVGLFSQNVLSEDADLAMKINKAGWKVEMSRFYVETEVPGKFKPWFKQKIRWNAGVIQHLLKHKKTLLQNPITLMVFTIHIIIFLYLLTNLPNLFNFYYSVFQLFYFLTKYTGLGIINSIIFTTKTYESQFITMFFYQTFFIAMNFPYTVFLIKKLKDIKKILLVIPFTLIYGPLMYFTFIISSFKGVKAYLDLKNTQRAW